MDGLIYTVEEGIFLDNTFIGRNVNLIPLIVHIGF